MFGFAEPFGFGFAEPFGFGFAELFGVRCSAPMPFLFVIGYKGCDALRLFLFPCAETFQVFRAAAQRDICCI